MAFWDRLPGEPDRAFAHFLDWLAQPKRPILALWAQARRLDEQEARDLLVRWAWESRRDAWEIHLAEIGFRVREQQATYVAEALVEASRMARDMAQLGRRKTEHMLAAVEADPREVDGRLDDARLPAWARAVGKLTRDLDRTGEESIAPKGGDLVGVDYSRLTVEELRVLRELMAKAAAP